MIKHISFKHGWYYHYRCHTSKTSQLCKDHNTLHNYLLDVFSNCPEEDFIKGPRSSSLKRDLGINKVEVIGHEICSLAKVGLNTDKKLSAHSKVQMFMLENDDKTIAVEVPLWLKSYELNKFEELFNTKDSLSGHIDALRIEENKIWIWDYKPKAHLEKYATTQIYFYALMLSQRTGINLDNFMCGYFDENRAYIFKPQKEFL